MPFVRHLPPAWSPEWVEFAQRVCVTIEERVALFVAERHARWVGDPYASGDARVTPIVVDLHPQTAHIVRCWFPGRNQHHGSHQAFIGGAWVTVQTCDERGVDHVCLANILPSRDITVFAFVPFVPFVPLVALEHEELRMYGRFRAAGLGPDESLQAVAAILSPSR